MKGPSSAHEKLPSGHSPFQKLPVRHHKRSELPACPGIRRPAFSSGSPAGGAFPPVMRLFGTGSQVSAWACPQRGGLACRFTSWATCSISIKHTDVLSDDGVVQRLAEGVYFQFFSGRAYFQPRQTCDSSLIRRD